MERKLKGITRRSRTAGALLLGLAGGSAGCRVPAPYPEQVRAYGFEDPRQAFESLVTAFQGNLLVDEYRCFSSDFVGDHRLSLSNYLAFRDDLLAEQPLLRYALYRSRVEEVVHLDDRRALLTARVPVPFREDVRVTMSLVREDLVEVFQDGVLVATEYGSPGDLDLVRDEWIQLEADGDGRRIWARAELPRPLDPSELGRLDGIHYSRQWRVDRFSVE